MLGFQSLWPYLSCSASRDGKDWLEEIETLILSGELEAARKAVAPRKASGSDAERACASNASARINLVNLDKAAALADAGEALKLFETAGDAVGQVQALSLKAMALVVAGDTAQVVEAGRAALSKASGGDRLAEAYAQVAHAQALLHADSFEDAGDMVEKALQTFALQGDLQGQLAALSAKVMVELGMEKFEKCWRTAKEAIRLFKGADSSKKQDKLLHGLALVLPAIASVPVGKPNEGATFVREASEVFDGAGSTFWSLSMLRMAVIFQADEKKFAAAAKLLKDLVKKTRASSGRSKALADDLLLSAQVLRQLMHDKSAAGDIFWNWEMSNYKDLCEEAVEVYSSLADQTGTALSQLELGHAHLLHGDFEDGRDALKEAQTLFKEQGDAKSSLTALLVLAEVELALGFETRAESAVQEVQSDAGELGEDALAQAATKMLAQIGSRKELKKLPPPEVKAMKETSQGDRAAEAEAASGRGVSQSVYTQEIKRAMKNPFAGMQSPVAIDNWQVGLMGVNLGVNIPTLRKVAPVAMTRYEQMQQMMQGK
mmetsp:Transcript_31879/g.74545  ORF Transcript_31879/g.74545 Transcript_31879/m.74545 type:complete len:546 (+) Transcript_31879:63-1700(+)